MRPSRTTSIAGRASCSMSQNHWSEMRGSTRRPERCECGTSCSYGRVPEMRPSSRSAATTAVLADRHHLVEPVAAADLEVGRVVAGGDLERAGAELGIYVLVGHDRQPAAHQREDRGLADQA